MIGPLRVVVAVVLAAGGVGLVLSEGRAAPTNAGAVPVVARLTPSTPATPGPAAKDQVATHSAKLADLAAATARAPVVLRIPALGIEAPVASVGVAADGQLAVPEDLVRAGWYGAGAMPGDRGTALIAAHVDKGHKPGLFFRLDQLAPGSAVQVVRADGSVTAFRVVARRVVPKPRLPVADLTRADGAPRLVLVTCGGSYDRGRRSYQDNVLVYAVPA